MLVKIIQNTQAPLVFNTKLNTIPQIMCELPSSVCATVSTNEFCYVVHKEGNDPLVLTGDVITSYIGDYDSLFIIDSTIGGNAAIAAAAALITASEVALIAIAVVGVVLSVVLTPDIPLGDPSNEVELNASSLYNGPVNRVIQGGVLPLVFGSNVLCGATRISAGISTFQQVFQQD